MSALDEIAKLKAARRAELVAAEAEWQRAAEQAAHERVVRVQIGVDAALAQIGAGWLSEYRADDVADPGDSWRTQVWFRVPGHRDMAMQLRRQAFGWELAGPSDGPSWLVRSRRGSETNYYLLADALIAAEIEGWTPPAPTHPVEVLATTAWAALVRGENPMPPCVAVDMVQDETDDRAAASAAIHVAAGVWLDGRRPEAEPTAPGEFKSASLMAAIACRAHLLGGHYGLAESSRAAVVQRWADAEQDYDPDEGYQHALNWRVWCNDAAHAIDLCRAVSAAAQPEARP